MCGFTEMSSIHCVAWVETGMRVRGGAEERWEGRGKLVGVRRSGRGEYSSGLAHGDTQGGCALSSCPVMLGQTGGETSLSSPLLAYERLVSSFCSNMTGQVESPHPPCVKHTLN